MSDKSIKTSNSVKFHLDEETMVSLGLIVNMSDKICMTIESFKLESDNTEYLEADGGYTAIEPVIEATEREYDDAIYDLQGRKVLEPQKGCIYIKNGKKFLLK